MKRKLLFTLLALIISTCALGLTACGDSYKADYLDRLEHNYESTVTEPTCTTLGYTTYTCECGESYIADYVDKLEHKYESAVTQATCEHSGYTTYTCECGDSYIADYIDRLEHNYESAVTEPTCITLGYTTYTCECGESYKADYLDKLSHKYESAVSKPTCTTLGFTIYICSCGHSYKDNYVDKIAHKFESAATQATCTTLGYTTYTCECGESYIADYVDKLEHKYVGVITEPTYGKGGFTTYTCECGDSYKADFTYYSFSVNFNLDGGTITNSVNAMQKVKLISEVVIPTVEKTGYIFLGWDKEISEINQDTTVTAQWQVKTYTVQLDADGATLENDSFEISYDEKIGNLPIPEKEGYKFFRWRYGEYSFVGGDNGETVWKIDAENIILKAYYVNPIEELVIKFELSCVLVDSENTIVTFTVDGKSSLENIVVKKGVALKDIVSQISKPVIEKKFRQEYGFGSWKVLINGKETSIGSLVVEDKLADVNGVITLRVSTRDLFVGPF